MPALIFDLIGPFVVQFKEGNSKEPGTGYVYAPLCKNHHANILTDTDDVCVPGNCDSPTSKYRYRFVDATAPVGVSRYELTSAHEQELLLVSKLDFDPLEGDQCHLVLQVPCPNRIVPLHTERVWIHQNWAKNWVTCPDDRDAGIVDSNRARGLRFIYTECLNTPEIDVPAECRPKAFSAEALGLPGPAHYAMTFRFADAGPQSTGQADAYSCFHQSRCLEMWPSSTEVDMYKWRVDFDDHQFLNKEGGGSRPRDCHAPVVVMQNW